MNRTRHLASGLCLVSLMLAPAVHAQPANAESDSSAGEQTITMNPFNVSSANDRGYATANSVGANMVNTPILDTSFSIVAFNRQVIDDVMAFDPTEAAEYASGVIAASNGYDIGQATIRGQNVTNNIRDGVIYLFGIGGVAPFDSSMLERVEVIKGPVGTMYGDYSGQGGLMNMVTKAPQYRNFGSAMFMAGADEEGGLVYRQELDVNAVDPNNPRLAGRMELMGQEGVNIQKVQDSRFLLMPQFSYLTPGGGTLTVRYIYQNPGISASGGDWTYDSALNISYFINKKGSDDPPNNVINAKDNDVDIQFEQPFKTGPIDWAGRFYFRYDHMDFYRQIYTVPATGDDFLNAAGQVIGNAVNSPFTLPGLATITTGIQATDTNFDYEQSAVENVDLVGKFDLGPTKNTLLLYGAQLAEELNQVELGGVYSTPGYPFGIAVWSNSGVPTFAYPNPIPRMTNLTAVINSETITNLWSGGGQENMSLFNDHLFLTVGFRVDTQFQNTTNYINPASSIYGDVRPGTSRKYGIVYAPWEPVRFFYNYSTTFTPNGYATNQFGQLYKLPNLVPVENEAGIKTDLLNHRLDLTASWFYTVIKNETVIETAFIPGTNNSIGIQVPAGTAIIKGWELDGSYAILPNLDLILSGGNLVSISQLGLYGRNVPFGLNWRALARYTLNLDQHPLSMGMGVIHDGPAAANTADQANIPPYTVANAFFTYQIDKHWKAQLNVNNVFNANYLALAIATTQGQGSNPTNEAIELTYSW